jgi:hypothetical protein
MRTTVPLLLVMLCAAAVSAGDIQVIDGRTHVRNPSVPPEGVEVVDLEEMWEFGGEDGPVLLGLPTGLGCDRAGRIYVLDAQLNQDHVLDDAGRLLATRFWEGDGPGEIRHPCDLIVWPDGKLGVVQEFPGDVARLDPDGNPLPTIHPGGPTAEGGWGVLMSGAPRGPEGLVVCGQMTKQDEKGEPQRRRYLAAFAGDGALETVMFEESEPAGQRPPRPREKDLIRPYMTAWDAGTDGRVVTAYDWDAYSLFLFGPDGKLDRVIERACEPWPRTDEDRAFMARLFGVPEGQPLPVELAETEPAVSILLAGVHLTEDGEIWVLPTRGSRDLAPGVLARFDVFDREGHFRRQVEVRCEGDPRNDRLVPLPGGRMIRQRRFVDAFVTSLGPGSLPADTREGEEATPAVICYRMVKAD